MRALLNMTSGGRLLATALIAAAALARPRVGRASPTVSASKSGWAWGNPTRRVGPCARSPSPAASATRWASADGALDAQRRAVLERADDRHDGQPRTRPGGRALDVIVGGGGGCVTRISENGGADLQADLRRRRIRLPGTRGGFSFVSPKIGLPAAPQRLRRGHGRRRRNLLAQDRHPRHRCLQRRRSAGGDRCPLHHCHRRYRFRQRPRLGRELRLRDPRRRRLVDARRPPERKSRHRGALRR